MQTLISVIIPIFNKEKYLSECLESLFAQCTEEVEVIMVNDGSTDRSGEICKDFLGRYSVNAKLINQENKGALKSREIGVSQSAGEYILFLDSDDTLLSNAVHALTDVVKNHPYDMVLFNATSDSETMRPRYVIPLDHGQVFEADDKYHIYRLLCCSYVLNNLWTKCIRKKLFLETAASEKGQRITNGEDLYQILDLADNAKSIVYLDRVLYFYRVVPGSMARNYTPLYFSSEKIVCSKRLRYAEKWGKGEELVAGARLQTYRIMRVVAELLLVSDMTWKEVKKEMQRLRGDSFFKAYYFDAHEERDKRDFLLKAPFFVMHIGRLYLKLKR